MQIRYQRLVEIIMGDNVPKCVETNWSEAYLKSFLKPFLFLEKG